MKFGNAILSFLMIMPNPQMPCAGRSASAAVHDTVIFPLRSSFPMVIIHCSTLTRVGRPAQNCGAPSATGHEPTRHAPPPGQREMEQVHGCSSWHSRGPPQMDTNERPQHACTVTVTAVAASPRTGVVPASSSQAISYPNERGADSDGAAQHAGPVTAGCAHTSRDSLGPSEMKSLLGATALAVPLL